MRLAIVMSVLLLGSQAWAESKKCTYRFAEGEPKFQWTAYKFTDKAPVKGSFRDVQVRFKEKAKSVNELLSSAKFEIDGKKIETGDVGRNQNIVNGFFEKMAQQGVIRGTVASKGDEKAGNLNIDLKLNGVKHTVRAPYTVGPEGAFKAVGSLDLMKVGLKGPFESLQKLCQGLHTGKDGVSKTWSTVDYTIEGKIESECQ